MNLTYLETLKDKPQSIINKKMINYIKKKRKFNGGYILRLKQILKE